jgi:hypothetical protein
LAYVIIHARGKVTQAPMNLASTRRPRGTAIAFVTGGVEMIK